MRFMMQRVVHMLFQCHSSVELSPGSLKKPSDSFEKSRLFAAAHIGHSDDFLLLQICHYNEIDDEKSLKRLFFRFFKLDEKIYADTVFAI